MATAPTLILDSMFIMCFMICDKINFGGVHAMYALFNQIKRRFLGSSESCIVNLHDSIFMVEYL